MDLEFRNGRRSCNLILKGVITDLMANSIIRESWRYLTSKLCKQYIKKSRKLTSALNKISQLMFYYNLVQTGKNSYMYLIQFMARVSREDDFTNHFLTFCPKVFWADIFRIVWNFPRVIEYCSAMHWNSMVPPWGARWGKRDTSWRFDSTVFFPHCGVAVPALTWFWNKII